MNKTLIALGFCAAFLAATPALAQSEAAPATEHAVPVSLGGLDMADRADAQALLSRLRYAAMRACEANAAGRPGPQLRRAIEECRTAALQEAVQDANSTQLSQLYSEQQQGR